MHITTLRPESRFKQIAKETELLRDSAYLLIFNKKDGLKVFDSKRNQKKPVSITYYNSDHDDRRYVSEPDYYYFTIKGVTKKFAIDRLIFICFNFGDYEKETENYILRGKSYPTD